MTTATMNETVAVAQISNDWGGVIGDVVQLAFSVGVAWYLLTETTKAIRDFTVQISRMNDNLEHARREVQHQGSQIRQEVRALTEATRRQS